MDIDSDKENQIHSFPARFGESITTQMSLLLTFIWMLCFIISKPIDELYFIYGMALVAILNGYIVLNKDKIKDFQTTLFRASIFTGWIILLPIILIST
jgi:4-hydroxybenzoate polyprenyltransferase